LENSLFDQNSKIKTDSPAVRSRAYKWSNWYAHDQV